MIKDRFGDIDEDLILIYKCRQCSRRVVRQEAFQVKEMTCVCLDCELENNEVIK